MNNVLYIGPEYKNHRGGIGAVMSVYATHIRPFKFIPTYSSRSFLSSLILYIKAIFLLPYKLISDKSIQIVHIHTASRGSFARKSLLALISKLFRKKVLLHIHGAEFHMFYAGAGVGRRYVRFVLGIVDAVVCLSGTWKEYFATNFRIKHLAVINNVIEEAVPSCANPSINGRIDFLFLGSIGTRKGIFDVLKVLQQHQSEIGGLYTLTVGGNGEIERLKQEISAHHSPEAIRYVGWVDGKRKSELLHQCDVYILPSYNEGLPISVLEAMAYGKPVISTNVGGIPEIVKPGVNGWLLEPGDHSALGSVIKEAISNRELLEKFGTNSLAMSRDYTAEAVKKSLATLYAKLLNCNSIS